jgi:hypothetical protein
MQGMQGIEERGEEETEATDEETLCRDEHR